MSSKYAVGVTQMASCASLAILLRGHAQQIDTVPSYPLQASGKGESLRFLSRPSGRRPSGRLGASDASTSTRGSSAVEMPSRTERNPRNDHDTLDSRVRRHGPALLTTQNRHTVSSVIYIAFLLERVKTSHPDLVTSHCLGSLLVVNKNNVFHEDSSLIKEKKRKKKRRNRLGYWW